MPGGSCRADFRSRKSIIKPHANAHCNPHAQPYTSLSPPVVSSVLDADQEHVEDDQQTSAHNRAVDAKTDGQHG
jgi:hypothetical protein